MSKMSFPVYALVRFRIVLQKNHCIASALLFLLSVRSYSSVRATTVAPVVVVAGGGNSGAWGEPFKNGHIRAIQLRF